ncbi:MAG: hypothetical protein NTV04_10415 [Deltaproteobacteria bacterium]|nr:hypothetical protein [Deltaproteobacteria bacterium]
MKAADDCVTGIAQLPGEIVSLEDQIAGALDGAEKRNGLLSKQIQVTESKDIFRGPVFEKSIEGLRVFVVGLTNADVHQQKYLTNCFMQSSVCA